jgi:hydrogenase maturation protease
MTAPLLVFGWGNLSRGDDALGPLFVEQLRAILGESCANEVEFLDDFQLQVEHALDLVGRRRVLFVDASVDCAAPFEVTELHATRDPSFTTHSMSPAAVLQVYRDLHHAEPPPCTQLAIRGTAFELGEPAGKAALANLALALAWARRWIAAGDATDTAGAAKVAGTANTVAPAHAADGADVAKAEAPAADAAAAAEPVTEPSHA